MKNFYYFKEGEERWSLKCLKCINHHSVGPDQVCKGVKKICVVEAGSAEEARKMFERDDYCVFSVEEVKKMEEKK